MFTKNSCPHCRAQEISSEIHPVQEILIIHPRDINVFQSFRKSSNICEVFLRRIGTGIECAQWDRRDDSNAGITILGRAYFEIWDCCTFSISKHRRKNSGLMGNVRWANCPSETILSDMKIWTIIRQLIHRQPKLLLPNHVSIDKIATSTAIGRTISGRKHVY